MNMTKNPLVSIAGLAALLLLSGVASSDDRPGIRVDPAHAGNGAYSGWGRDAGEPGQRGDPNQYGLDLRHLLTTTPDGPYAGTRNLLRRPIAAAELDRLSFDISGRSGEAGVYVSGNPKHGYCTGGAPRFVVEHTSGTCHLGCGHGDKVQDPNTNWWTISFEPPFAAHPGCGAEPVGTVDYIDITHDEGPSQVVLDNISATINGGTSTVGKPDGDEPSGNDGRDESEGEGQITICHIPPSNYTARHTITIGASAWPDHQSHCAQGTCDYMGSCR